MLERRIEVRRAGDRFYTEAPAGPDDVAGWAQTWHSFSFGTYYDPRNVGFGALVAHNDETVRSGSGYTEHAHLDTEIVTWVLSGSLVHSDSTGHRSVVGPGLVQRLSAGSGVVHAERNDAFVLDPDAAREPVHFLQTWVRPDEAGVPPAYTLASVDLTDLDHGWCPIASGTDPDAAVDLGSAASTLWVTRLAPGVVRGLPESPRTHVFVARGAVEMETAGVLGTGDAVRIEGRAALRVTGLVDAEVCVWGTA